MISLQASFHKTSGLAALQALRVLACGLALGFLSPFALAEKADKDKPINLEADSAVYDDVKQVMVVEGRVLVTKGTLVLRATRLEQREDRDGYQFMDATAKAGERVFFRQKREGLDEFMEGEANRIEYDGKLDVLKLTGKAVMRRLRGSVVADESMGNVIVFNNMTETLSINGVAAPSSTTNNATSQAPSQRVRMMLSPKTDATKPQAAPAGAAQPPVPSPAPVLRGATQLEAK